VVTDEGYGADAVSVSTRRVMANLKMRHLRLLKNLERHKSLTKVAHIIGISQPAATKMLSEIEDLFDGPLFIRAGRGLKPTRMGEVAMLRTAHIIEEFEHFAAEMEAVRGGRDARLIIGAAPYVSGALMSQAVGELYKRHNVLSVIKQASSDELVQALSDHQVDCALARTSAVAGHDDLCHEILHPQRPVLVGNIVTVKRLEGRKLEWRHLAEMNWILPSFGTPVGRRVAELFTHMQVQAPSPIIETYSIEVMYGIISKNPSVISVVPEGIADDMVRRGGVGVLPWKVDWELSSLSLIYRAQDTPLRATEQFAKIVRELCLGSC